MYYDAGRNRTEVVLPDPKVRRRRRRAAKGGGGK